MWDRIAPGLRKELEERNPKDECGRRRFRYQQWLAEDIGDRALVQHPHALMGLQRACPDRAWKQCYEMVQRAFPRREKLCRFLLTTENLRLDPLAARSCEAATKRDTNLANSPEPRTPVSG